MKRLMSLMACLMAAALAAAPAAGQGYVDQRVNLYAQPLFQPYGARPGSNQNYSAAPYYGLNNLRYGASFQGHRDFLEDSYTNTTMGRFYRDTVGATDVTNGFTTPGAARPYYNPSSLGINGATLSSGPTLKPADPFGLLPSAFNSQTGNGAVIYGRRPTAPTPFYLGPMTNEQGTGLNGVEPNRADRWNQLSLSSSLMPPQGEMSRIFAPSLPLSVPPPSVFSPQITFYSAAEAGMKPPADTTGRILPFVPGTAPSPEPELNQNESGQAMPWTMTPNGHGAAGQQPGQSGISPEVAARFGIGVYANGQTIPMPNRLGQANMTQRPYGSTAPGYGYQTPPAGGQYGSNYSNQNLPQGVQQGGAQPPGGLPAANGEQQGGAAGQTGAAGQQAAAKEPQAGPAKPRPVGEQYYELALMDLQAGVYHQAAEAFGRVAQFSPALKFEAERGQGVARLLSSDYYAASHLLSNTLLDKPEATPATFRVTSLAANTKDWHAADAALAAILKETPNSAAHAFDLAYLRIFTGRPQGLGAYLQTAEKNADLAPAVKILRARITP